MNTELSDRIGRVIKTVAFERTLETEGILQFKFKSRRTRDSSFEDLPKAYQQAILAGEKERHVDWSHIGAPDAPLAIAAKLP